MKIQTESLPEIGLAEKYLVDDLPGALQGGARLNGILRKIEAGEALTVLAHSFLASNGLLALQALMTDKIDLGAFRKQAAQERADRMAKADIEADRVVAERIRQAEARGAAINAHFAAMANDPILRRKRDARELRNRFDIGFVDSEHYPRVMALLKQVSNRQRLRPEDVAWLSTEASDCWTGALQQAWHHLEAEALSKAWENNGDVWDAVNASGHWRKAGKPDMALEITEAALAKAGPNPKPRSALATTCGGAMRDLRRLADAQALGMEAHNLTPTDFRPCTLFGAVHIELGEFATGCVWYKRAENLGASRHAIDQDLRALLFRSDPAEKNRIRAFLVGQNPARFGWLRA